MTGNLVECRVSLVIGVKLGNIKCITIGVFEFVSYIMSPYLSLNLVNSSSVYDMWLVGCPKTLIGWLINFKKRFSDFSIFSSGTSHYGKLVSSVHFVTR